MSENKLAQRFDQAWERFTYDDAGVAVPVVEGVRYQYEGVISGGEDGKNEVAAAMTHETPYVPGSLRPHSRMIEIFVAGTRTALVSDVSIHFFPNRQDNASALDAIERFRSA